MTGIELLLILKAGSLSLGLFKFFENKKVQESKRRVENQIYNSLSNINYKLDEIIANPLRSAFSYLEMAKNSNGSNKDTYTQQAMFKLVEATQYMKPDCPDWQTAHKALAMCQYYNQDYLNAIRSLDKSLIPVYNNYSNFRSECSEYSSDYRNVFDTMNLIAELWCKAIYSDPYLKTICKESGKCLLNNTSEITDMARSIMLASVMHRTFGAMGININNNITDNPKSNRLIQIFSENTPISSRYCFGGLYSDTRAWPIIKTNKLEYKELYKKIAFKEL